MPFLVYVPFTLTSITPAFGMAVGGVAGGGAVTVSGTHLTEIYNTQTLADSEIWCRFGPDADGYYVQMSQAQTVSGNISIECLPPAHAPGPVIVYLSLNNKVDWLLSTAEYTYRCDDTNQYVKTAGQPCVDCPSGATCNGFDG